MARISEDPDSWRAGGLVKKYADWEKPPVPQERHKHSKKKSDRWCKGQEGHEHDFSTPDMAHTDACWRREVNGRKYLVCFNYRHGQGVSCSRCQIALRSLSKKARKAAIAVNPKLATEQEKLAEKWCGEGHMYDWQPIERNEAQPWRWSYYREKRICVMCGLIDKYRR